MNVPPPGAQRAQAEPLCPDNSAAALPAASPRSLDSSSTGIRLLAPEAPDPAGGNRDGGDR